MATGKFLTPVKLSTLVGGTVTIHKIIWGTSRFGEYALIIRDAKDTIPAASTSNKVVMTQLKEMDAKTFPVEKRVIQKSGQNGYDYLVLEDIE